MKFVICTIPDTHDEDLLLKEALLNNGYDVLFVDDFKDLDIASWSNGEPFLYHGSLEFAQYVNQVSNVIKVFTPEHYSMTYYSNLLLNRNIPMLNVTGENWPNTTLLIGDKKTKQTILNGAIKKAADKSGRVFIRPDSGMKDFSGMVFINKEPYWSYDTERVLDCNRVIISEPRDIIAEWRFVVWEDIVIDGSLYMPVFKNIWGGPILTALAIAQNAAKALYDHTTHKSYIDMLYTIDVCSCDLGYFLLEVNSFVSAGLYAMDYDHLAKVLKNLYK